MNAIAKWLGNHNISTHTIGVLITGLILYYRTNPDFNALVTHVQSQIPKWVITLGIAVGWLYSWYRNGQTSSAPAAKAIGGFVRMATLQMLLAILIFALVVTPVVMTTGCAKVQQTLQTVLKKAPTVIAIVKTGIDLASVVDPGLIDPSFKPLVSGIAGEVTSDLQLLSDSIAQYQTELASAPPGAIAKARELYTVIDSKLAQFEQAFHLKGQKVEAQAATIVDFVDIFLSELGSLLPPGPVTVKAQATPRTQAAIVGVPVKIISARAFAQNFNRACAGNFPNPANTYSSHPQLQVAVP